MNRSDLDGMSSETRARLRRYDKLRGKPHNSDEFWDMVVLTAIDEEQKQSYKLQLQRKSLLGELPLSAEYVVIADPPGPKIGNGGSTLFVIHELKNQYGEEIFDKKIIIVHAGGFSQRLPNASILGKVFLGIPIGEPMYQSLDLKLASYIDFPSKISGGGIFVCSADTIEVYDDCGLPWRFPREGFSGLAHLSPVSIGRTHGVYVVDRPVDGSEILWHSAKFLHKPSIETMNQTYHCVVQEKDGQNWVITDSAFFISKITTKKLLNFYEKYKPITCEIDAYGDFLQASGTEGTPDYTRNTENVCKQTDSLIETRLSIFDLLKGTPLYAIVLAPPPYFYEKQLSESKPNSIFYHIGTMPEYLSNFCRDSEFRRILSIEALTSCSGIPYVIEVSNLSHAKSIVKASQTGSLLCEIAEEQSDAPCIIGSVINPNVTIGEGSIIEYSILGTNASVGCACIVSGCCLPNKATLPNESFYHTVPIRDNNKNYYVTVAFEIKANIKKTLPLRNALESILYFGRPLKQFQLAHDNEGLSLWTAKMFPRADTMERSFELTCQLVTGKAVTFQGKLYSMSDLLALKHLETAIGHRKLIASKTNLGTTNQPC